jgi:hypothetical protein
MMSRVIQVENLRAGMEELRNWDAPIQIYHDETNNIRRLTLTEVGLNAPENRTFAIAGVALQEAETIAEWTQLRRVLWIQASAPEIKFEHLAKGSYEDALGSQKIELFLNWLLDRNMMIHYSALDPLYWSILDIIESLQVDDRLQINLCHMELKTELHHAVLQDASGFMTLLHQFNYPDLLRAQVHPFLEAVMAFVDDHVPKDRSIATTILRQTLRHAARLPGLELAFLHDNRAGELIADFSSHFLHRIYTFKNAAHVFDNESYVEKAMQNIELHDGEHRLNYRFADSKAEEGIQLSDVVTGLIGRHFSYLKDRSLTELMRRRDQFNETQLNNLTSLRKLIDQSDAFSDGLFHAVLPLDTIFKNEAFLHEAEVPPFMWQ